MKRKPDEYEKVVEWDLKNKDEIKEYILYLIKPFCIIIKYLFCWLLLFPFLLVLIGDIKRKVSWRKKKIEDKK